MSELKTVVVHLGVFIALGLCGALQLPAHPFHTTTAEMEYNAQSKRFEVAIKVPAADLEEALSRQGLAARNRSSVASSQSAQPAASTARVKLDSSPEVKRLITAYLNAHFFLSSGVVAPTSDDAGTPVSLGDSERQTQGDNDRASSAKGRSTLHWVGMEFDKSSVWLYVELQPPPNGDRLSLVSDLFFELNSEQINTCTLRMDAKRISLRTDARQPQVALPPQAPAR